jgi:pilus assembly protein Flp/PilA
LASVFEAGAVFVNHSRGLTPMSFSNFLKDESGAAAAEYALILAIVTAGIVIAVTFLGKSIANALNNAASYITLPASS